MVSQYAKTLLALALQCLSVNNSDVASESLWSLLFKTEPLTELGSYSKEHQQLDLIQLLK